jgi:PAS domain S-box-containing protein
MNAASLPRALDLPELRQLADMAPIILRSTDAHGACVFLSRRWYDSTGQTEDEALGAGWIDAVHPDDRDQVPRALRSAAMKRGPFSIDYRLRQKDGQYRWVMDSGNPRFGDDGEFLGFVGCVIDIHERKLAREDLQASEERYKSVLRLMPAGLYMVEAATGTITYFNEQAARIWGRAPRLNDSDDRFCGSYKIFMPDGSFVPHDQTPMAIAIREGRSFRNTEAIVERPDGTRITALVNIDPLRDARGRILGAVNVFYDISDRRRAEQALRDREEHLLAIVEATPECVKVVAADGTLLQMNRSGLSMVCAANAESVVGHSVYDIIAPEDRERFKAFNERVCAGTPGTLEFDIVSLTGERRHMDTHAVPLRQSDGSFAQLAITRDVTHQRAAARALLESERRYRAVVESLSEMVCRFRPDGTIQFVNSAYASARGRTAEEMVGQNFWNFIPREDQAGVRAMLAGLTPQNPQARIENRFETTEGTRWTLWTNRALTFDADGRASEVQSTGVDITDRRRAEQALRTEEEKFRLLADTIPQLAWMARPDGHIFWYNKRWYEYTGKTPQEMEGWGWQSVHDPHVLPQVLERWKATIESGDSFDMVFPLLGADGQFRPFLTRVNPLRDARGQLLFWFGTNTDISEIKRMEQALLDADRRKDEFLAILSHELRNPLAPIKNFVSVLRARRGAPEVLSEALPVLDRQVGHLVRLVDDLLDVARINRGDIVLQRRLIPLGEIVTAAVETSQPLIEARNHQLAVNLSCSGIHVLGDPVRLAQVLANVLNNAASYTPAGGRIEVVAQVEAGRAVLRVRDNGPGFSPETARHMFELFVRGNDVRNHPAGFGIGLALARRLVQMHGGSIEAFSAGQGSEFVIQLPVAPAAPSASPALPRSGGASGKNVLVVDDNVDAAESLALLLNALGANATAAYDGHQALAAFEQTQYDVVLLDIGMPGMDGYQVAREIRARHSGSTVTLVALTGWGQEEDRWRAKEAGFDHHLVKPAEIDAVEEILART